MTDARPILVFDSGVGGLSVLAHIQRKLPQASIVYAADNARYPYGTKSEAEIAARVPALLGRLAERYRPRLIVIACNTASTIALSDVRSALDLPIVGTVPAIKPAAAVSKTRIIGVLGTNATVRQPYVDNLVAQFAADCTVLRHGSSDLVDMAEAKLRGSPVDPVHVRDAISGLYDQPDGDRLDAVVLACTHFPLLAAEIQMASPHPVALVDSGEGIARRTAHLTAGQDWPERSTSLAVLTQEDDTGQKLANAFQQAGLGRIEYL